MDIITKLKAEEGNRSTITLYEDRGLFAHAYERSAFALTLDVKTFDPNVFNNSKLKMKYIQVGIPKANLRHYLAKYKFSTDKPEPDVTVYVVRLDKPLFTEEEFQKWKESVIVNKFDEKARKQGRKENPYIIDCKNIGKSDGNQSAINPSSPASTEDPAPSTVVAPVAISSGMDNADKERLAFLEGVVSDILAIQVQDFSPMKALNYLSDLQNKIRTNAR